MHTLRRATLLVFVSAARNSEQGNDPDNCAQKDEQRGTTKSVHKITAIPLEFTDTSGSLNDMKN